MTTGPILLEQGSRVDDLVIQKLLGKSDSSATYLATDPRLGTSFVLREYLPARYASRLDDGRVLAKNNESEQPFTAGIEDFLAEGRLLASLDHESIVKVLRFFEANGTAYLLMPDHGGRSLAEVLRKDGELSLQQARTLVLPLLDALEYLHDRELVHQDISPENILIREDGRPLLFDLAAAAGQTATSDRRSGGGAYSAPEQFAEGAIGPWTDFYALAATLYRCISGNYPAPANQRLVAVQAGKPDPLQAVSAIVDAASFGSLTDLIEHGLELDPAERPDSARRWKTSFESLDWRRSLSGKDSESGIAPEEREWLPMVLLAVFLLSMGAIAIYLLTGQSPDHAQSTAGAESSGVSSSPAGTIRRAPDPVSAEETSSWQAALQADTVTGYRRFMSRYPESIYLEQAQLQLDILDDRAWQALSAEDTRAAYEDYLAQFPAGSHQAQALVRIDEIDQAEALEQRQRLERETRDNEAWEAARNERSVESMDRYMTEWPAGLHVEEAGMLRRALADEANDNKAFELALSLNTREAYQAYIDAFPRGTQVTRALESIEGLTFRPGRVFRDCEDCPAMIVVPPGAFWQGSADDSELALGNEKPRRMVTIAEQFAVSVHEVTMDSWDACFSDGVCSKQPGDNGWGRGSRPVIMVTWNDTQEYIQWLNQRSSQNYRLPSESEWEYFARAGEESDWLGGGAAKVCEYGNVAGAETGFRWQHGQCEDGHSLGTLPTGSLKKNAFGLFDVIGNVSEWTSDCMNLSYLDAPVDGSAWGRGICSSHVTRGGSWVTGSNEIRLPARFNLKNGDSNDFTGFRVVRAVEN